jgi:hypothetical protein
LGFINKVGKPKLEGKTVAYLIRTALVDTHA